jgi:hypothetical protein
MNLYNHNTLGTEVKPLIPNQEFKLLHESLLNGDKEKSEEILSKYTLESYQKQVLESLIKRL